MPERKKKAPTVNLSKQIAVAEDRVIAKLTLKQCADRHNVTVAQVKNYAAKYQEGFYKEKDSASDAEIERIIADMADKSISDLLDGELRRTIAEMQSGGVPLKERAAHIQKLTSSFKALEAASINMQIKNPDAERVAIMMRLIKPELTDTEIIEIFKRADEIHKEERKK